MTDLSELIERVKAATGPDRDLDIALLPLWEPGHDALKSYDDRYQTELRDGVFSVWKLDGGYSASIQFPRFTTSIDAALALAERVLPGWTLARLSQDDHKLWYVELRQGHATSYVRVIIAPSTIHGLPLPLSIILALLLALESQP